MNKINFLKTALIIITLFTANVYAQPAESTVINLIQATVDQIADINLKFPGDPNKSERRGKIREVINPRFDFQEMAKRSLGPDWNNCTPDEQKEFVSVFSELLAKTYMNKVESLKKDTVKILSAEIRDSKALVKTKVLYNEDTFPLDYKMLQQSNDWKVYDVVIENIGLVVNYRNEFAGIIRKDKIAGLIIKLKDKLKQP